MNIWGKLHSLPPRVSWTGRLTGVTTILILAKEPGLAVSIYIGTIMGYLTRIWFFLHRKDFLSLILTLRDRGRRMPFFLVGSKWNFLNFVFQGHPVNNLYLLKTLEADGRMVTNRLKTNGNNQVLIKSWLDQCCDSHGPACVTKCSKEFSEMANQSYFGVIDVLDMCLKSLPRREGRSSRRDSSPRRSLSPYDKVERVRRAGRMGRMPTPPPRARNERPESFYSYEDIEMPIRPSQNDHGNMSMSKPA